MQIKSELTDLSKSGTETGTNIDNSEILHCHKNKTQAKINNKSRNKDRDDQQKK